MMKKFTPDVIDWWIRWNQVFHDERINKDEAEKHLNLLKSLIQALKKYPR